MNQRSKASVSIGVLVSMAVVAAGLIAAFVRVQTHAEDPQQHITREHLQEEYVPRRELDHRLDAQDRALDKIQRSIDNLADEVQR
jgi:hypothetical protein